MTNRIHLGYALKKSLKNGYNLQTFKNDAFAGLIVSLVALPLAMALAIAIGLSPQHGIYTAIVAGLFVPLFGGSTFQVSGPTAAFVVIIAPIVAEHGLRGLIITTIIAGVMLIIMGLAKLGRYVNYIPYPVVTGFTSGIAVVIFTLALNDFLGLGIEKLQGEYLHKIMLIANHIPVLNWPEALVGAVSLALMFSAKKFFPKIPSPIIGIGAGALLAYILARYGFNIATIGNRFSYQLPGGGVGHGIPPFPPKFHLPGLGALKLFAWPSILEIQKLLIPSLIVAVLGALESLLSAAVADGIKGTKHHPNSELIGIGIGNILSGLASGMPATGAVARTVTNVYGGAKTPFASSLHALFIMLYVLLLAPYMSYIPMASLAALLIMVAYRMSHWQQFIRIIQIAPKSDILVLITCFGFTVLIDMVAGVTVGVILACFLLIKQLSNLTHSEVSHASTNQHWKVKHFNLPDDVMIYHIKGSLFFGTAEKALNRTNFINEHIRSLIIDMENVPLIDMTGLVAMKTMILGLQRANLLIVLCGNHEVTAKIQQKLPAEINHKIKITATVEQAVKLIMN